MENLFLNLFFNSIFSLFLNSTPLNYAVEQEMTKVVQLLLANKNIDVNYPNILNIFFNTIAYHYFVLHFKS